jgi:hypothetical protein
MSQAVAHEMAAAKLTAEAKELRASATSASEHATAAQTRLAKLAAGEAVTGGHGPPAEHREDAAGCRLEPRRYSTCSRPGRARRDCEIR